VLLACATMTEASVAAHRSFF